MFLGLQEVIGDLRSGRFDKPDADTQDCVEALEKVRGWCPELML